MSYLKLEVYVPENDVKKIVKELNKENLIGDGAYDYVYTNTKVKGHFRALKGANPYIGEVGKIEEVDEIKLEFRVREEEIKKTLKIVKDNHPYEVPVINIIKLLDY